MNKQTNTAQVRATKKNTSYSVGSHAGQIFAQVPYTTHDFKNAILIVSLTANAFFLTLWLTTQVSTHYAMTIAQLIIN
jgi:hypothetical protein